MEKNLILSKLAKNAYWETNRRSAKGIQKTLYQSIVPLLGHILSVRNT